MIQLSPLNTLSLCGYSRCYKGTRQLPNYRPYRMSFHHLCRVQCLFSCSPCFLGRGNGTRHSSGALPLIIYRTMKRKATSSEPGPKAKRPREQEKDYCDFEVVQDDGGNTVWPAPLKAIQNARAFLKSWYAESHLSYRRFAYQYTIARVHRRKHSLCQTKMQTG